MPDAELHPVERGDFDRVYPLLERFQSTALTREDWRHMLFDQRWKREDDPLGFALWAGKKVVGYIGNVYSYPQIAGTQSRFCNLSSWIVDPGYRSHTLFMARRALADTRVTYTALTCIRSSAAIFLRLGFRKLEERIRIFHPLSGVQRRFFRNTQFTAVPSEIERRISEASGRLLQAHMHTPALHLWFENRVGSCYLLLSRWRLRRYEVLHVHHASDPDVLWRSSGYVQRLLFRVFGTHFWMVDERHAPTQASPWSISHTLTLPRLFRPADQVALREHAIESTFSELMYLRPGNG